MAPKKGKKGGKGAAGKLKAEEARLALLRSLETEAEDFQRIEGERRRQREQEDRMTFFREEQARLICEKERHIDDLTRRVAEVTSAMHEDHDNYASQVQQLSILRDSLLNEISLMKVENEELQRILEQERQHHGAQTQKLRAATDSMKDTLHQEKVQLRTQVCEVSATAEELKQQVEIISEAKETNERDLRIKIRDLERHLEKALAMNSAMQEAVQSRESDERKNITLLQLLNTQLDQDKQHYERLLGDERSNTQRVREEVARLEAQCATLQKTVDAANSEKLEQQRSAEGELREYKQQLEQLKFDTDYLNSEMENMRSEFDTTLKAVENARESAEEEARNSRVEVDVLQKKTDELEDLLYRKEREHFDKCTFLNAQVLNSRTAIAQLQQKLGDDRKIHESELTRQNGLAQQTIDKLSHISAAEGDRKKESREYEEKLVEEVVTLKTTLIDLRNELNENEIVMDRMRASKDEEIARLQAILDAHFIPNRQDVEVSRESQRVDEMCVLKDQLKDLQKEMLLKEGASKETEVWLRSRIASQEDTIESLQLDLKKQELSRSEEVRTLEDEVGRLRKTLEIHFIPCS